MNSFRAKEALMRDVLLGEWAAPDSAPPVRALRALRWRRRRDHLVRTSVAAAALVCLSVFAWRTLQHEREVPVASPAPPSWLVRTQSLPASEIVHTAPRAVVVRSPSNLPQGLVVHSRAGLYSPLSDEGLLAMLADRSPVLIGAPGKRRLIFQDEGLRQ